jgi:hypothetical protein
MSGSTILNEILGSARGVAIAVLPLAALFTLFQVLVLKLPRAELVRIVLGTALASLGLFLFLVGVGVGFLPMGRSIGEAAGALSRKWLLFPFGFLLGFVTTWGEPAVRVLADQVEEASAGSIPRKLVLHTVCFGVAVAVGLGMLRVAYSIPLVWLIVPAYGLVLVVMWFSDPDFVSIGIDAGGVATGPLANTFLLALALGAAAALGEDALRQGLGLVALIAVAPVVSVTALGLLFRRKRKEPHP